MHWIGRLVRAAAEIEDIVNEHFSRIARIPLGAAILILGRMPTSALFPVSTYGPDLRL